MDNQKKPALPFKESEHYSNILLMAPDGGHLAAIPIKRARYYQRNNLVEEVEAPSGFSLALRLINEPKGRSNTIVRPLINQCVVCGGTEKNSVHHVVPHIFRSFFPDEEKNYSSNWCVLVCETHHLAAEKIVRCLYEKPLQQAVYEVAKEIHPLNRAIVLAAREKQMIPDFSGIDEIRKPKIKQATRECILRLIESFGGLQATKELFKNKFLELNPQFLPEGFLMDGWQR